MPSDITQTLQLNEKTQIRIRLNVWKESTKLYIQSFYKPGEDDNRGTDDGGYAFGKAATIPEDKIHEFNEKWIKFYALYTEKNGSSSKKGKKSKKQKANADDVSF